MESARIGPLCLWLAILLVSCAPASGRAPIAAPTTASEPARRSMTIALAGEPGVLEPSLLSASREIAPLASAFLVMVNPQQEAKPYLAAELPSVAAGTWKVLPNGTMETTYKLRPNATWHDGQPLTAHDFVFAFQARLDPTFPGQRIGIERRLSNATAVDDHTLFLEWKQPYMNAGRIAPPDFAPMHRQNLERVFNEDKPNFVDGPHWREQFVGAGPYRVERWEPGVEIAFRAHEGWVLGKPGIDQLLIKIIPDSNTITASLLGNQADIAFSESIGFPQGQALEGAWSDGKVTYRPRNPRILEFQTRDWGQTQRAVSDVRVRRAALYAIDRQAIVDTIYAGKGRVVHFWLPPSDPSFAAADRVVPKYDFDPARAAAMLTEAGWTKGADGIARNPVGEPLDIPMQNQPNDFDQQEALVVADNWKGAGINSEVRRLSPQELRDNQLRSTYAGVAYSRRAFTLEDMVWISPQIPRAENRWAGQNRNGYQNQTLEDTWLRALGTIDQKEREGLLIQALQSMMDDAVVTLTHMQPGVMAYNGRAVGPEMPDDALAAGPLWNVGEWRWN